MLDKALSGMNSFESPVLLGNLLFALPAIAFGLLWYTEKTAGSYVLLLISIVMGVFLITWATITRLHSKADLDQTEKDLAFMSTIGIKTPINEISRYLSKGVLGIMVLWMVTVLYSTWITLERVTNPSFAAFLLLEIATITYAISATALKPKILDAGMKTISKMRAAEKKN